MTCIYRSLSFYFQRKRIEVRRKREKSGQKKKEKKKNATKKKKRANMGVVTGKRREKEEIHSVLRIYVFDVIGE